MSYHLLFIAICSFSLLYISNSFLAFLCMVIYFLFYWFHFKKNKLLFLSLLCYAFATNMVHVVPIAPQETIARVTQIRNAYVVATTASQDVILYNVTNVNFDDVIQLNGSYELIEGIHNEGEFHFPTWANRKGMYYSMNVTSYHVLEEGKSLRHSVFQYIQTTSSETSNWLNMMLFQLYEDEEVSYMALSSGMHIQVIVHFLTSFATLFFSSTTVSMLMILFIGGIGLSTIMSVSMKRIVCSKLIYLFFHNASMKDRLGLEIIVIMLFFPSMRYELAFLLPMAYRFLHIFNVHRVHRLLVSFLLMIPMQFYFYQSLDVLQILTFPFFRIFYAICYGAAWIILCFPLFAFVGLFFNKLQQTAFHITEQFPKWYYLPSMFWLSSWIYYVIRYWNTKQKKLVFKLLLLLIYTQISSYLNPFLRIMTIDVGQGDCTLFILPFHQGVMLLDVAGNRYKNIPEDIILPILHKRGIFDVDKVILTHDDFDHSGGLPQLEEHMEIQEIITQKQERIDIGSLPCSVPLYDKQYDTSNDNSILLFLDIYGYTLLFMGDAGHTSEQDLLKEYPNLKVDILKVGHHGSKHSSLPAFIHQVDPILALISCGRHNRYHHPDPSVMKTLEEEEVYPLNTANQGSATLYFSKFISFYKTADGEFGIIKHR